MTIPERAMVTGFAPIARPDALVLILGTAPSRRSLEAGIRSSSRFESLSSLVVARTVATLTRLLPRLCH